MAQKSSWTKALFVGLWTVLNFCRKLFFNVIFIVIIVGIIAVAVKDKDPVSVKPDSALLLNLKGNLVVQKQGVDPVEQFMQEAFDEQSDNPEVLLRELEKVLDNAKQDNRIKALILDLQGFSGGGLDKLRQAAAAIDDFKTSGKPVYAIGDYYTQSQYYLAAHADHIYLNPMGGVMFEGYGRFRLYYKNLLEKLKVSTHVFRVGTFKSAIEPYIRDDMSPAAKEANQAWLTEYWEQYKADVAAARDLPVEQFDEQLDQIVDKLASVDGDFADYALRYGWVDALKTREDVRQDMLSVIEKDDNKFGFKVTTYNAYAKVVNLPIPPVEDSKDRVEIVVAKGTILDGSQKAGTIGGDSTARLLRDARLDDKVKAVVMQVDSPGGSAFASEVIRQEVLALQAAGKPVVVSMGTYAASGGYWISANADKIYASPATITGSIGVFGMMMTYENIMDYIGVNYDGVGTTELAGISPTKPLDDRVKTIIQGSVENIYSKFINMVAEARDLTPERVDEIAQGRVWIGTTAKEIGLVDELGELDDAVSAAAELASLTDYKTTYASLPLSPKQKFWQEFFGQGAVWLVKAQLVDSSSPVINLVKQALREVDSFASLNDPRGVYVMCLECEVTK